MFLNLAVIKLLIRYKHYHEEIELNTDILLQQKCMASNTGANGAFVEGCFTKARDQILVHTEAVGGVTLAIVIIMAINLILSLILCTCGFDNEDDARPRKGAYTQARQDRI